MNPRPLLAFLLLALPAVAAPSLGKIQFLNHDQLNGTVAAIEKDRIVWSSPLLEKPAPFQLNKILEINQPTISPELAPGYEAVVSLTNGDTLRGQLASVNDKGIELDTWYAGRILLNRVVVESVKIEERAKLLYHGPDSLDGWTRAGGSTKSWTYESGNLISGASGSIARDVKLPDQFRIAFNMEWRASLRIHLICCSDKVDAESPTNCYDLTMQRRFAYLRKKTPLRGPSVLGQNQNIPEFAENESARVELCVDRKKGVFNLIVDGRSAAVWNDNELKDIPTGGAFHFVAEDNNPIRISRIEVSAWDGVIEQMPDSEDLNVAEQQDNEAKENKAKEVEAGRMMLRNGDSLAGEVLGIENGVMKVKTRFSEINLPVSRLKTIMLKPAELETPKLRNGDIRAWFANGSRVVFRLDSATPETLTGYSQNFGTATFKVEAFSRIEFNLYDPAFQEARGEKSW